MALLLDADASAIREAALKFMRDADPIAKLRQTRNAHDGAATVRGLWSDFVDLGFAGALIPEEFGGTGLSPLATIQIAESMGRTLATAPFVASAVMAATALLEGTNDALKKDLLPQIAAGRILSLAVDEGARHHPGNFALRAQKDGTNYRLTGAKQAVIAGGVADDFIVAASGDTSAEVVLLLVSAKAKGLKIETRTPMDSLPIATLTFESVEVPASALIAGPADGARVLEKALDLGRLHLAAEMLGAADEAFERTVEYLKTRVQFGKPIGEFQALQHRAALLFGALEVARSALLKAATEGGAANISLAKAEIGETARHVTTEAVQLHGGIGVTDEFDIGLYLKRVRVAAQALGDGAYHAERYARLNGL